MDDEIHMWEIEFDGKIESFSRVSEVNKLRDIIQLKIMLN